MWPSGKAQDLGPTVTGFDPHLGTPAVIIKYKVRAHYEYQKAMVSSPLVFKKKGRVLLCREVSPVWMRIRLRFQQKQRVKEERVKKISISLGKSSEPQVGLEPAFLKEVKVKKTYKFRSAKVPSPRWDWNLRRSQSCVNMMVFMQF